MTDTLWADVSSYQPVVNNTYPYPVLAIRSNDGDYVDPHFAANYGWAQQALTSGRLSVLIVYYVYRQNWQVTVDTHRRLLGTPHPGVVSMVDIESWGGKITGDQSAGVNAQIAQLGGYWGDQRRVIAYGNHGDLDELWLHRPDGMRIVLAAYGSNPGYPGKLAHQFTDHGTTAPFGACDLNSADGLDVAGLRGALGLDGTAASPAPANPTPTSAVDPASLPVITDGVTSPLVWQLQGFMDTNYGAYSHIDRGPGPASRCGPATEAAITEFQRRVGIPAGGTFAVGRFTWQKLIDAGFRP